VKRLTFVVAALASLTLLGTSGTAWATPAPPGPGNSAAAHACQNGGWQNVVTSTGATFANQDECVAYAAHGGALAPKPTASLVMQFQNCTPSTTDAGRNNCYVAITGAGLQPNGLLAYCRVTEGFCVEPSIPISSDGTANIVGSDLCVPGNLYDVTGPTASGGTITSQPVACPALA
jgi:hypothetical protein